MRMKSDAKFEEKLTCCFEKDMRNVGNFYQSTRKCQNWNFDGILCPKQKMHEVKIYKGVMCHDNEERYKN